MAASGPHGPSRRTVARGAAWSLPVVAVAATAPARAASCQPATVSLVSAAGGNGYDVRLGDTKVRASATTNYLASGNMAALAFEVGGTGGVPVTATVACDGAVTDDEGNSMIRFVPIGSGSQSEAPGASAVTVTTDSQGRLGVWCATATYRQADRAVNPALDNHGTFTVTVPEQGAVCATVATFTFQVIDAAPYAAT